MQPRPITSRSGNEGFNVNVLLLLVLIGDGTLNGGIFQGGFVSGYGGVVGIPPQLGSSGFNLMVFRFYSLRPHKYVHILRFRSNIYTVHCSSQIIVVSHAS